ncbi:MAG TPA: response regulator [Microvirga sp.]|nr:response regulator [Microvirga sp.]
MSDELLSRPCSVPRGAPRGLILEDQALIGMSLEAYLEEIGIEVCGVFVSEAQALGFLEHQTPDFAILDYSLKSGPCTAVARLLRGRGVPVIVYSGHARRTDTPGEFTDATWIEKPAPRAAIIEAITRVVQRAGGAPGPTPAHRPRPERGDQG